MWIEAQNCRQTWGSLYNHGCWWVISYCTWAFCLCLTPTSQASRGLARRHSSIRSSRPNSRQLRTTADATTNSLTSWPRLRSSRQSSRRSSSRSSWRSSILLVLVTMSTIGIRGHQSSNSLTTSTKRTCDRSSSHKGMKKPTCVFMHAFILSGRQDIRKSISFPQLPHPPELLMSYSYLCPAWNLLTLRLWSVSGHASTSSLSLPRPIPWHKMISTFSSNGYVYCLPYLLSC